MGTSQKRKATIPCGGGSRNAVTGDYLAETQLIIYQEKWESILIRLARNHYYYNAYSGNFGDELGVEIVRRICRKPVRHVDILGRKFARFRRLPFRDPSGLFALGSIFSFVRGNDVIWGTGVKSSEFPLRYRVDNLDIRSVRGPLTCEYLRGEHGLECPREFGDPALLTARLFPEYKVNPVRSVGVIPHFLDIPATRSLDHVVYPNQGWRRVLEFIVGCELVVSSSLHGLIVAESFGIPARWWSSARLPSYETEGHFKFNDYFASTDRELNDFAETLGDAVRQGGKESIRDVDEDRILNLFPHDRLA